jgi:hypothetical protein
LVAHEEKAFVTDELEVNALIQELGLLETELEVRKKLFQYRIAISFITDDKRTPTSVKSTRVCF